jgi:anti-sigma factor RsiW
MKPELETRKISAFVDGELDLTSQLQIEERLRLDSQLRVEVEYLRQLREALRGSAEYHRAPAALRARTATLTAPARPPSAQRPGVSAVAGAVRRWLGWRTMVPSWGLVGALALAVNLAWLHSSQEDKLLDDVVASHVRSTLGEHLVDVASSDHHTVKPWLSSRLDFSPPVSELRIPGSVFLGGRVDYLDGRPVAALVYRQGQHIVNSFVWPSAAKDSQPQFSVQRGFQMTHWTSAGMSHWVISDVNRQEFTIIVQAIQLTDRAR